MKKMTLLFLFVYAFGALSTTQTIPLIKENGFTSMQQGYLLASIALFTIVLQIVFGILSDRTGKMKIYFMIVFAGALVLSVYLYMKANHSFWQLFWLVGVTGGAGRCYQSMVDTWALEKTEEHRFERDKAIGSVGWALGSWLAALIAAWLNWTVLSWTCLSTACIAIALACFVTDGQRRSTMKWNQLKELISNKEYVTLVLTMLILFSMGCADIYLVVDKMMKLGGTSFHIGLKWGIQSLAEAPVFLISDKLLKKFHMLPLLIFSTVMFGVRFLIYGLVQHVWVLVCCALLQSLTFPIAIYCTKIGIDRCTDTEIKSTGQLAAASVYMGLSLLVMPVASSWLSDKFSHDTALFCVAAMSILALVLIGVYRKLIS